MEETMTSIHFPKELPTRTKIVATIGPASESEEIITQLIRSGVDVFRLNLAHRTPEESAPLVDRIRKISRRLNQPVAILADLAGPKMRLGEIPTGEYLCRTGETIRFIRGKKSTEPGVLTTTYASLVDDLKAGDRILLADGTVTLTVIKKGPDSVEASVLQGGMIRSRQGINLPGVDLSIAAIQAADRINAVWGVNAEIDFLGLSFVRSPKDIRDLRKILEEAAEERVGSGAWRRMTPARRRLQYPNIIAKIEKPEALPHLEAIAEAADGVMAARGDLGVETNIARIAMIQKEMIRVCRRLGKPVIVATQMLETMTTELLPTRAEATDVANAILDGTDACMLSGETAIGSYPVEAVQMMAQIIRETEKLLEERKGNEFGFDSEFIFRAMNDSSLPEGVKISVAVCDAAGGLADQIGASMIAVATQTGQTALNLSSMRNFVITVGTSENEAVLRRMALYWGVIPVSGLPSDLGLMLAEIISLGKERGYLKKGDSVVVTAGLGTASDDRNAIYVHLIE